MSGVSHRIADFGRSVVAYWTPTPTSSQFQTKGTLTPSEFVDAGDQLTFKFPTWRWQSATPGRGVNWLPECKQYLITKNVSCLKRIKDIDEELRQHCREDADDGWLIPMQDEDSNIETLPISSSVNAPTTSFANLPIHGQGEEQIYSQIIQNHQREDEVPDLISFNDVDDLLEEDDDPASEGPPSYFVRSAPDDDIIQTRTYDLSITYDKYYQTPRLWLFGYDENGVSLKPDEIFEDILTEYVSRTVTVDPHPCTGIPTASIHPCRHARVMKKVVDSWRQQNVQPRHDLALFVILRFISSVIPTIDYDYTMDIDMFFHESSQEFSSKNEREKERNNIVKGG